MAHLTSILKPLCRDCPEPASHELRNRQGKVAATLCHRHAGKALKDLHAAELAGMAAPNGDGRFGLESATSPKSAAAS